MGAPLKIPSRLGKYSAINRVALFSLGFLLIGLAIGYFTALRPLQECLAARSWVETPCQIVHSEIKTYVSNHGHGNKVYSADISFRYEMAGQSYVSNQYDFTSGYTDSYSWPVAAVQDNPPGKHTVCYVDPQNPTNAVLSRTFEHHLMIWVIAAAFGLFGLAAPTVVVSKAAYKVVLRIRFGRSVLDLKDAPVPLGDKLEGTVLPGRMIRPEKGFEVKLSCIHHTVSVATNARRTVQEITTREIPLWVGYQLGVQPGIDGSIAVSFALPADGYETSSVSASDRKFWRMEVKAKVPGIDYAAQFEVPVVQTSGRAE